MSRKDIFVNNLLGGIAWALGATIGVALILTVVGFVLSKLDTAPFVGEYVRSVNQYLTEHTRKP